MVEVLWEPWETPFCVGRWKTVVRWAEDGKRSGEGHEIEGDLGEVEWFYRPECSEKCRISRILKRRGFSVTFGNCKIFGSAKGFQYINFCYRTAGTRDPPSPPMVTSPLWCGVVVWWLSITNALQRLYEQIWSLLECMKQKGFNEKIRSKKGSMKRWNLLDCNSHFVAKHLLPLWWWCAADIASRQRKEGKREGKEKRRRERRKAGGKEGRRDGRMKGSPPPLGLGGWGGYHLGGGAVGPWSRSQNIHNIYIYMSLGKTLKYAK